MIGFMIGLFIFWIVSAFIAGLALSLMKLAFAIGSMFGWIFVIAVILGVIATSL